MALVSIHLSNKEEKLINNYCKLHGISISEAFKETLLEKIEDEFDLKEFEAASKEITKNKKTYSIDELRETYNL